VPSSIGGAPLVLLERFGYRGEVHLVSRTRTEVNGRRCVSSIEELPHGVDAAILAIPKAGLAHAIEACGRAGVGGAIAFSSGFAEVDADGASQQVAMAHAAATYDLALAGPNCLGLINFVDGVPLTFGDASPNRRAEGPGLAILAQSGAMSLALTYAAMAQDINVSYAISTGNEAVLGVEDYLDAVLRESSTRVVALLVEQIRRPAEFLRLAKIARDQQVALCVAHLGRDPRARAASASHTGAITGEQDYLRAALGREGVLFIDSLDGLIDTAGVLVKCPLPRSTGTAVLTDSGAAKTFALDVSHDLGLAMPDLAPDTCERLRAELPPFAVASNPADITAMGLNDPSLYARVAEVLLSADEVGCLVVSVMPGSEQQGAEQIDALLPTLVNADKPVVYAIMGGESYIAPSNRFKVLDAGLPLFRSPERALTAVRNLTAYAAKIREPGRERAPARRRLPDLGPLDALNEHAAKSILSKAGLRVPRGELATDLQEARSAASRIGYPVALKISSAQVTHKSDVGGVALVTDEVQLDAAYEKMLVDVVDALPEVTIDGVLVEQLLDGGVEMIVGARRDPAWGEFLIVGFGGVWTEVLKDAVVISAQAAREEISASLSSLRGFEALTGIRGQGPSDIEALVEAVETVGGLLHAAPAIVEIEVNPLVVFPRGAGTAVLDAVIVANA
jgi:acetate---CoA ligase (ADP-forming)